MNELDILDQLENTPGLKAKTALLEQHKDNAQLVDLLDAALSFKRKYFIKKFEIKPYAHGQLGGRSHRTFLDLLSALEHRDITGNEAISEVQDFFAGCLPQQAKWYSRVLLKNLKCDVGVSLCKKAGINIEEFEVMLAKDGKECKNLEEIVKKGVYVSPKFDGYRVLAVCSHGDVTLYSRNGTVYENFPAVEKLLSELCQDSEFVLDGEIMSDDFNAMQQTALSKKSNKTVGDIKYHVFGWVPADEWKAQEFKTPTKQRLDSLQAFFEANLLKIATASNMVMVKQELVYSVDKILDMEKDFLAMGYEGAMILPNIPYYLGKKSNRLMKFKTFMSMDCEVLGLYAGEAGKEFEHTMGGISVRQENGELCKCGSGWSIPDRDYMWNNRNEFIGRIVELSYQDLTPDRIMRFPTFVRWRDDK